MTKNISNQIKVLFIDDDFEDMELFQDALKECEPTAVLTWLRDGRKVKEHLIQNEIHLYNIIFLDINMPLIDGISCLKNIREIPELGTIPVVMFSTYLFDNYIEESFFVGANLYVQKPFDFGLYHTIFKKVFSAHWEIKLLETKKENYLLNIGQKSDVAML